MKAEVWKVACLLLLTLALSCVGILLFAHIGLTATCLTC